MKSSSVHLTNPKGYHIYLQVYANGNGTGKGTHVSAFVYFMKGINDAELSWPFVGNIIESTRGQKSSAYNIDLELGLGPIGTRHSRGLIRFIPHSKLAAMNTQYLRSSRMTLCTSEYQLNLIQHSQLTTHD